MTDTSADVSVIDSVTTEDACGLYTTNRPSVPIR
jgi:hypothetical protein